MKNIAKYLFAISAAAFTFAACEKEAEIKPGEPELDNCYGVYFPVQEASGDHIYNPTQDKVLEITVARTNTEGAITVPVTASFTDPKGPTDVFTASDVVFADGQAETTFTVNFDNAEEGVKYAGHFVIEDNQYASIYSKNSIGLDFTVMCVEMLDFKTEDGSENAMLTFSDDVFWGEVHDDVYLKYYEVDGIRYCETTGGKLVSPADGSEGIGPWGTDVQLKFKWYTNQKMTIGEDEFDFIEVEPQYHGWFNSTRNSEVWFADYYNYYQANASTPYNGDAIKFFTNNGDNYPPCYYDGRGGFVFNLAYYMPTSGGYWYGFNLNAPVAIASGYTRVDYSLKVAQTGVSEASEVPVSFEIGTDVAKVYYEFKEGTLSNIQITNALAEMDIKQAAYITESGVYNFNLGKTGEYTLIAQAVDDKDNVQNSASAVIVYLNADDAEEHAVQVSGGLASAEKYVPKGVNPENSLEFFLYGSDLIQAKMGVYSFVELSSDQAGCIADLMDSDDLDADTLAKINSEGWVDIITGLIPGTEFYMLVYANNGYAETVEIFGPATTSGDPLPIYMNYTANDFDGEFVIADASGWMGTWNYYAVDFYGSTGMREYLGKVKITASDTPTEGPDGSGYYDEYVLLDGLFPNALVDGPAYGYDTGTCVVEMDAYNGILYSFAAKTYDEVSTLQTYSKSGNNFYNGVSYYSAFIPVADGYYAFVDVAGSSYNFTGLRVVQTYVWDAFYDLLLVDPEKDENGLANAPAFKAQINRAADKYAASVVENANLVITDKARIAATMKTYKEKMRCGSYGKIMGLKNLICPAKSADVVSVKYNGPVSESMKANREPSKAPAKVSLKF